MVQRGEKPNIIRRARPGANCGKDHQLLICKFKLKFKKMKTSLQQPKYNLDFKSYLKNRSDELKTNHDDQMYLRWHYPRRKQKVIKKTGKKRPKWLSEDTLKYAIEHSEDKASRRNDEIREVNRRFQRTIQEDKVLEWKVQKLKSQETKRDDYYQHSSNWKKRRKNSFLKLQYCGIPRTKYSIMQSIKRRWKE